MPRRRPTVTSVGGLPGWPFADAAAWAAMEKAYGRALEPDVRHAIHEATDTLVRVGRDTASVVAVVKRHLQIKHAVQQLERALSHPPNDVAAAVRVEVNFDPTELDPVRRLATRATQAAARLDNPAVHGLPPGTTWAWWVCEIARILKSHGLPVAVRMDFSLRGKSSPFVKLIAELQRHLPPEHRRAVQSLDALSQAIKRALRDMNQKTSD
jgi:hypothetical protein